MITARELTFTYPGTAAPAVRNLAFDIQPAEVFGFLGPSGAGKSTTQKILIGLLKGFQGQITIMGRDLTAWGPDLYEQIGVTFELPNHYLRLTGRENLNYFRSLYSGETEDPDRLLAMVGLDGDADKRVGEYSKGMQARLNFVRGLLNKPKLVFMDEPTAGLDPVNAANIKDIVRRLQSEGVTIFLTTHDMTVADELCDRVAFIVDGEISVIDPPQDLKLRYGQRTVRVAYRVNGQLEQQEFSLDGLADNADFLTALRNNRIETIHSQETTLERVFIRVTGKELV
jgi:fluoroquinolone transport system ATP-binding protein